MSDSLANPMSTEDWLQRLRTWGVRPSKSKGQNFLLDADIVSRIADEAGIAPGDQVIEIGPGLGVLSAELLSRGAQLTAIELDDTLAPRLDHHFRTCAAFMLVHADASKVDPGELVGTQPYVVVANLPYSVATMIVRHYLESSHPPARLTIMVQREVAQRMAAQTGEMSLLALAVGMYAIPTLLFDVPKEAFYPVPKVTSSVIRLVVRDTPLVDTQRRSRLFAIATLAFRQRRKTLHNSLSRGLSMDKDIVAAELVRLGVDQGARPQSISLDDWLALSSSPVLQP